MAHLGKDVAHLITGLRVACPQHTQQLQDLRGSTPCTSSHRHRGRERGQNTAEELVSGGTLEISFCLGRQLGNPALVWSKDGIQQ